jgi:hypothetical protein
VISITRNGLGLEVLHSLRPTPGSNSPKTSRSWQVSMVATERQPDGFADTGRYQRAIVEESGLCCHRQLVTFDSIIGTTLPGTARLRCRAVVGGYPAFWTTGNYQRSSRAAGRVEGTFLTIGPPPCAGSPRPASTTIGHSRTPR